MNACHHTFVLCSIIRKRRRKPRVPCVLWGMMIYRSLTVTNVPVALGRDAEVGEAGDGERGTLLAARRDGEPRTAQKQSTGLMKKQSSEYSKPIFPGHCTRPLLPPELLMCIWSCVIGTPETETLPLLPPSGALPRPRPFPGWACLPCTWATAPQAAECIPLRGGLDLRKVCGICLTRVVSVAVPCH